VCGVQSRAAVGKAVYCACGYVQLQHPPGLGDRVAAALARVGITEQRYRLAKQAIGLKPDCDCKKRQRLLNQLGGGRARHDDPA
jgi:hypothetical protein